MNSSLIEEIGKINRVVHLRKKVKESRYMGSTFKLNKLGLYFFGKAPFIHYFNVEIGVFERVKYD